MLKKCISVVIMVAVLLAAISIPGLAIDNQSNFNIEATEVEEITLETDAEHVCEIHDHDAIGIESSAAAHTHMWVKSYWTTYTPYNSTSHQVTRYYNYICRDCSQFYSGPYVESQMLKPHTLTAASGYRYCSTCAATIL